MAGQSSPVDGNNQFAKIALGIGFVTLAIGILVADAQPVTGYEVSIYHGTTVLFWLSVAFAMAVSLIVSILGRSHIRLTALLLGGTAIAAIIGLPFLRSYYFYGTADALTHLGWTKELSSGVIGPSTLFYPGIHSFSVVVHAFTGIEVQRAILFVVAVMTITGVVFIPLAIRTISDDDHALVIASFSTFLLFMVHNLGVYLHPHSFAQATFFGALIFFLLFVYLTRETWFGVGVLLVIASATVIVYHPQVAANVVLIFGGISAAQFVYRRYKPDHPISSHRALYAHTAFITFALGFWLAQSGGRAFFNFGQLLEGVLSYLIGDPPTAGESVQTQATSLIAIGSGIPEIFMKLFLVAAIYSLLTGGLMAASIFRFADENRPDENAIAVYFSIGSVGIFVLAALYFMGNVHEHYLRHLGFLLVIGTIVGSFALIRIISTMSSRQGHRLAVTAVVIFFAVLLPLSLATLYPSPFIYKQSQHVTETNMAGYQTVFDTNDESLPLGGIRDGPHRYSDALLGVTPGKRYTVGVTDENLTRLTGFYPDGGYVIVTEYDEAREVEAYKEIRYNESSFRAVERQQNVNQVVSNGELKLFHVSEGAG